MQRFNAVEAILFDLDGTLIDSAPDLGYAADQMRVKRGLHSLGLEPYRPMAGAGARGMLGVAFGITPDAPEFDALREEFFANYATCMTERTSLFEGVENLLTTLLSRGLQWGVVTNKSARFTNPLTSSIPLFASAATIVSGDTTPHTKPHPAPLLEACSRMGIAPHKCLYVGDDERDIIAGLAAGMGTVAASYGYLGAHCDVAAWGAHASISNPMELAKLLW